MKLRSALRELVPPIFMHGLRAPSGGHATLFDGQDSLFRELLAESSVYGEYGVGLSTLVAVNEFEVQVQAVDTSQQWIQYVLMNDQGSKDKSRLSIEWVDLGPIGDWGRPLSYSRMESFYSYTDSIWRTELHPDLVLIDGRFRVACFFQTMLRCAPGTRVLFDDYNGREHYHVVEKVLSPVASHGRQALFIIPQTYDVTSVRELRDKFLMVMD